MNVNGSAARDSQQNSRWILPFVALALLLMSSGCGGEPIDLPSDVAAQSSSTPADIAPPADTATPFVPGACEAGTQRLEMNTSLIGYVTSGTYPDTCFVYCLSVPAGRSLEIGIRDFSVDLDMYVDMDLSVLAYSDHGAWESNAYGTGDEAVSINNPAGEYYIQVCSYEGLASDFTVYSEFAP